ncbi:MAG: cytochrome d ubiquinol oxidase subunit I [Myxococcota bacterium]|jgi:cytochrome d ubiquinol oxidase subunit I
MTDLFAARSQMAMSLAFHIVFAVVGIGMPLLMVIAEGLWLRTQNPVYRELARRWSKGTAILFAVGAVSGTVLSFELGLLWPGFMEFAGPIIGMPFSLEGFAFFTEAIFLGVYLYGWDRISPRLHWLSGIMVMVSGMLSGVFVLAANAWMNNPVGFEMADGVITSIDPVAAMFNPGMLPTGLHMTVASFETVGFAVAGIHAFVLLRNPNSAFHKAALAIALTVGSIAAVLQPATGHFSAQHVAEHQPVKLAAMEALWETTTDAPFTIGGLPNATTETTPYSIEVPYLLSFLAFDDIHAEVQGLDSVAPEDRPNVAVVHVAFEIMVGIGMWLMGLALVSAVLAWRVRGVPTNRALLWALAFSVPLGFIAVEAGWTVTEVGRQPWVIYEVMRTADAVTPVPHLVVPFLTFSALYLFLGVVVLVLLKNQVFATVDNEP